MNKYLDYINPFRSKPERPELVEQFEDPNSDHMYLFHGSRHSKEVREQGLRLDKIRSKFSIDEHAYRDGEDTLGFSLTSNKQYAKVYNNGTENPILVKLLKKDIDRSRSQSRTSLFNMREDDEYRFHKDVLLENLIFSDDNRYLEIINKNKYLIDK